MAGAPLASLRYNSPHRQALEYASSRQPYAFERHTGYRAGRGAVGVGGGDIGGTGRGTVDVGAMVIGDKAARDGGLLCEVCGQAVVTPLVEVYPRFWRHATIGVCLPSPSVGPHSRNSTLLVSH